MRLQPTVSWIVLLCATVASAAQPDGQPALLDRVLGQLHDSRAARASSPKQGKISSRLLPPLAAATPAASLLGSGRRARLADGLRCPRLRRCYCLRGGRFGDRLLFVLLLAEAKPTSCQV